MTTQQEPGSGIGPRFQIGELFLAGEPVVAIVVDDGTYRLDDLLEGVVGPTRAAGLFEEWPRWHPLLIEAAKRTPGAQPVEPSEWRLPVIPSKLICIGTNYHDHLREMGTTKAPQQPYTFLKPVSTGMVATGASVALPARSKMVDWEAELALVIGRTPQPNELSIMDCVAGYTLLNDLSARDWIINKPEVGIDWVMMKAYDGFSPVGPLVTPAEFVADPQNLAIRLWVNGELKQDSNTSQMVFSVAEILQHLAGIMTLLPGDVIATGTPAGVGFGQRPQQFLKHGDTIVMEIEGLGRLETHMVDNLEGVPA